MNPSEKSLLAIGKDVLTSPRVGLQALQNFLVVRLVQPQVNFISPNRMLCYPEALNPQTDKLSMKAAEICLRREASVGGAREQHHKHIHNKCLHASPTMALNELINIEWNELGVGSRWENISSVKRSIVCGSELVICMFTRSSLAFNRRKLSVLHEISDASHQKRLRDPVDERRDIEAFN